VLNLHVDVAERQLLGILREDEVTEAVREILDERGAFPQRRHGPVVYEGAVITADNGKLEISWARTLPLDSTVIAEQRRQTFPDVDSAIKAFINSEWPRGIDGIAIQRR
jgi:hypothetical protein